MSNRSLTIDYDPSPITELRFPEWEERQLQLFVKRDDLLRPAGDDRFCGNKVRKLKYNLEEARKQGFTQLLTFGGAYSNHIAAVARAGKVYGFSTIGVVRGEPHDPLNPTLAGAVADGMQLHYLDRTSFRQKNDPEIQRQLLELFGRSYVLPEGGTNELALKGCAELASEIALQLGVWPAYLAVACGTGGTMAGLIRGCAGQSRVLGVSALKGNWMPAEIEKLIGKDPSQSNWEVFTQYHFGGYAKFPPALKDFLLTFEQQYGMALDPVYTAKLFFGILDQIRSGYFPIGSKIVVVHSGGLQGRNNDEI